MSDHIGEGEYQESLVDPPAPDTPDSSQSMSEHDYAGAIERCVRTLEFFDADAVALRALQQEAREIANKPRDDWWGVLPAAGLALTFVRKIAGEQP